jgi:hypothetical protein
MGLVSFNGCAVGADGTRVYTVKTVPPLGYLPWTAGALQQDVLVTATANSPLNFFYNR